MCQPSIRVDLVDQEMPRAQVAFEREIDEFVDNQPAVCDGHSIDE